MFSDSDIPINSHNCKATFIVWFSIHDYCKDTCSDTPTYNTLPIPSIVLPFHSSIDTHNGATSEVLYLSLLMWGYLLYWPAHLGGCVMCQGVMLEDYDPSHSPVSYDFMYLPFPYIYGVMFGWDVPLLVDPLLLGLFPFLQIYPTSLS